MFHTRQTKKQKKQKGTFKKTKAKITEHDTDKVQSASEGTKAAIMAIGEADNLVNSARLVHADQAVQC